MIEIGLDKHGNGTNFDMAVFRVGSGVPKDISYDTLPLNEFGAGLPASSTETIAVDEQIGEFCTDSYNRTHMNYDGIGFVQLNEDGSAIKGYAKGENQVRVLSVPQKNLRQNSASDIENASVGIRLSITKAAGPSESNRVYFDNAMMKVSNIMWQFSVDNKNWMQLFDLPNREYTRVVLPKRTDRLYLQALSNSPDEWIQRIAIKPHADLSIATKPSGMSGSLGFSVSKGGVATWNAPSGAKGDVQYTLSYSTTQSGDKTEFKITESLSCILMGYFNSSYYYHLTAKDETGQTLTETTQPDQ